MPDSLGALTMKTIMMLTASTMILLAPYAAHADDAVMVHIDSNKFDATLERVRAEGMAQASGPGGTATAYAAEYEMVCTVPCDKSLDRNRKYVFRNVSGFQGTTAPFILPPRERVKLDVKSGSPGMYGLGFLLTVLGGVGVGTGGAFALVGSMSDRQPGWLAGGLVTLGVSTAVLVGGIVLMVTNGTSVTTEQGESLARTKPAPRFRLGLAPNGLGGSF